MPNIGSNLPSPLHRTIVIVKGNNHLCSRVTSYDLGQKKNSAEKSTSPPYIAQKNPLNTPFTFTTPRKKAAGIIFGVRRTAKPWGRGWGQDTFNWDRVWFRKFSSHPTEILFYNLRVFFSVCEPLSFREF